MDVWNRMSTFVEWNRRETGRMLNVRCAVTNAVILVENKSLNQKRSELKITKHEKTQSKVE